MESDKHGTVFIFISVDKLSNEDLYQLFHDDVMKQLETGDDYNMDEYFFW